MAYFLNSVFVWKFLNTLKLAFLFFLKKKEFLTMTIDNALDLCLFNAYLVLHIFLYCYV